MKIYLSGVAAFLALLSSACAFTTASFSPHVEIPAPSGQVGAAIGDLDGDGKPEVIVANYSSATISVFRNISVGGELNSSSFAAPVSFAVGGTPILVRLADLDGDARADVLVVNQASSKLSLLRNTATMGVINSASLAPKVDLSTPGDPRWAAIADLDGDGRLDVVSASYSSGKVSLFQNGSSSGSFIFSNRIDLTPSSSAPNVELGDVDGDGKVDMLLSYAAAPVVAVYRNVHSIGGLGAASFATPVEFGVGNGATITLGDVDGDGKLDLVTPQASDNTVSVLRNTATAGVVDSNSFAARITLATGGYPYSAVLQDLDGDGLPEIAVAESVSSAVSVYRNLATSVPLTTSSFATRVAFATGAGPRVLQTGDLDGDGAPDLLTPNLSQAAFSILRNLGTNVPPSTNAPTSDFNLGRDFSAINNPNGVWSFGWKSHASGPFSLLTEPGAATADNGVPVHAWVLAGVGQPAVYGNDSTGTGVGAGGQFVIPPATVWVHPGMSSRTENLGAVRFTAPSNFNYRVQVAVQSIYDGSLSDDNEFRVAVTNTEIFTAFLLPNRGTNLSGVFTLVAGETVDLLVGRGADGNEYGSALKVSAVITPTTDEATVITNTPPPPVPSFANFDLGRDFSAMVNPNGAWAYGWKETLSGSFTADDRSFTATTDNGVPVSGWAANSIGLPAHYCNTSGQTAYIGGGQGVLPPRTFWMHPGHQGQIHNFGVVRFTAPSNANYLVEIKAESLYSGYLSGDTDFHIIVNGVEVFGQQLPATQGTGWTNVVALNVGDTVDLAIGRGADGNDWGAGLKVLALLTPTTNSAITITNPPPPPPPPPPVEYADFNAGRDFASAVNPAGAWSYGWKGALDGAFTLMPIHFGATTDNGVRVSGWAANHTYGLPALYCNTSAQTGIFGGGQANTPPGTMWFHPGANGQPENFGVLRFTAPSNANYRIEATAASLYSGGLSGDTDFHVVVNGIERFGQGLPATAGTAYTNVVELAAGDTVDFAIGRGADGDGYGAGLKILALLTPTSEFANTNSAPAVAPVIVSQSPAFLSATLGSVVSLNVAATGSQPLHYQWYFEGTEISGATSATLTLSNVQTIQAGTYRVVVSNLVGLVTNNGTALSVTAPLGGTITFANSSSNRVFDVGGELPVPAGGSLVAALFASTNDTDFAQVGGPAPFIVPGRFSGGMRYVPGTAAGQTLSFQVRVWDTAAGSSFEAAATAPRGVSGVFQATLGGGIQPPTNLRAMSEFSLTLPGIAAAQPRARAATPVTIRHLVHTAKGWAFMINGPAAQTFVVESSTNLVNWQTVAYAVANEAGVAEFVHKEASSEKRFYRARLSND